MQLKWKALELPHTKGVDEIAEFSHRWSAQFERHAGD